MAQHSLQTASVYLNNLLLARGLLRNGKSIDFARPDKSSGGTDATMAKVINLVHDLVLRRDRETEQREGLAATLRTLRANETQHASEVDRIKSTCDELRRNLSTAEAQERALKASAHKAEVSAKELKEQMQRMKSTLDQIRSKCQNDVRKRDIELEKLKNHLVNLQRGKREGTGMNLITIAPHLREKKATTDTSSPDYSLEQESNAFLASFVKSLNADLESLNGEHRWLLYLIRRTKQELERIFSSDADELSELGFGTSAEFKVLPPTCPSTKTYEELAVDMNQILEHCGAILNNPSYVSIEEVEIRETEIVKLREGWEKMAGRLKEALAMMDTWRRRMINGGETVGIEELGRGMDLGKSIAVTSHLSQSDSGVDTSAQSLSLVEELDELDDSERLFGPSVERVSINLDDAVAETQTASNDPKNTTKRRESALPKLQQRHHLTASPARRFPFPSNKQQFQTHPNSQEPPTAALTETTSNIPRLRPSPRKVSFFPAGPEIPAGFDEEDDEEDLDFDDLLAQEAARAANSTNTTKSKSKPTSTSSSSSSSSSSKTQPRLTIPEKLALAQAEADAEAAEIEALAKARLQAATDGDDAGTKKRKRDTTEMAAKKKTVVTATGTGVATGKRTRRERERGRRRSTLAPEELEVLMGAR